MTNINLNQENEKLFFNSCINNQLKTAQWLYDMEANVDYMREDMHFIYVVSSNIMIHVSGYIIWVILI